MTNNPKLPISTFNVLVHPTFI